MGTMGSEVRAEIIERITRYGAERLSAEQAALFRALRRGVLRPDRSGRPREPAGARSLRDGHVAFRPRALPPDRRGAAEGLRAGHRRARLRFAPFGRGARGRGHAVPRRLDVDGAVPSRLRPASRHPSGHQGAPGLERPARGGDGAERGRRRCPGVLSAHRDRPSDRARPAGRAPPRFAPRRRRRAGGGRGLVFHPVACPCHRR